MSILPAIEEAKIISFLLAKDPRGAKLLRKHYTPVFFGAISRIVSGRDKRGQVLEDIFSEIASNILNYDQSRLSFFSWAMQIARRLGIAASERGSSLTDLPEGETVVSLVMERGFSIHQAARVLEISPAEVALQLRRELKLRIL